MTHPETTHDTYRITVTCQGFAFPVFPVMVNGPVHRDQVIELFRAKFPPGEGFSVQIAQVKVEKIDGW